MYKFMHCGTYKVGVCDKALSVSKVSLRYDDFWITVDCVYFGQHNYEIWVLIAINTKNKIYWSVFVFPIDLNNARHGQNTDSTKI